MLPRNAQLISGFILCCTLAACSSNPLAIAGETPPDQQIVCDQILRELSPVDLDVLHQDSIVQWIGTNYQLDVSQLDVYEHVDGSTSYLWKYQGKEYTALFRNDGELIRLSFRWETPRTGRALTECLGPPDLYEATYRRDVEANALTVGLWYLNRGVIASDTSYYSESEPPDVNEDTYIEDVFFVKPGSAEEAATSLYAATGSPPDVIQSQLQSLRSWPTSWDSIEVEVDLN